MTVLTSTDYVHVPATSPVLMTEVRVTKVLVSVVSATELLVPVTEVLVTVSPVEVALMNVAHEMGASVEVVFLLIRPRWSIKRNNSGLQNG